MAKEDVFNKEFVDERDKNNLEGLLEQLNLPPAVVKFVKANKRVVQIGLATLVIVVVAWALYGSYRDDQIQKSSAALSSAMDLESQAKLDKLAEVEKNYSGTDAALWAQIIIGQELLKEGKMEEASGAFHEVQKRLGKSSPLEPLVLSAMAQADEALSRFEQSGAAYQSLTSVEGYQELGYLGLARIHEIQGDKNKALEVYEKYLGLIDADETLQRVIVEEKIARIRAAQ